MIYIYEFNSIEWWLKYNKKLEGYIKEFRDKNPNIDIEKSLAVGEKGLLITININNKNEDKGRKPNQNE